MSVNKQKGESFIGVLVIIAVVCLMVTPGGREFLMHSLHAVANFLSGASEAVSQAAG